MIVENLKTPKTEQDNRRPLHHQQVEVDSEYSPMV